MMKTILTGVTAYISTGLDYLIILMVIFARVKHQDRWLVLIGDFLGTIVLVGSSLLIAFFLGFVPAPWLLGFLGLIPIYLGIKLWVQGDDDDTDAIAAKVANPKRLIGQVALITMATCGADNVGIYVPIFTTVAPNTIPLILLTFAVMVVIFWEIGYRLACLPKVADILEREGRYITVAVYILIGLYIMYDSGTFQHLLRL
ncbi:MAG: cadmium resistance transporter [Levilactobacillus sp.]|jgi:cadmium resistance transport/sequestration family protein|uniref:cadmium resistance transporter n=1 Tax=Levilactobacillus sp. TaxID=2767919 RepID=UPI00258263D5|nr:cadmium resistance transporter [Levilactobacillus sp.]MCH4124350.1 cadmium resistance transporter [Levilactobacillus sp.]MCI1553300.1 cadmium resistance transporter [Levilactobacillus sp.]MCI1598533.1 cadmium resistance transporter [Levilactobacillus sp.]MCI1605217.1 cadmium resistance transporter [Levilactobacillus sp.]